MSLIGTEQERTHQLVHRNAATEATKNMTQDAQLKIVKKTGSNTNKMPHPVGCKYIQTIVNSRQLTV